MPIGWESDSVPELRERPQEILNRQLLSNSDLLVGMFWSKLGTPTGRAESGTVEEVVEFAKRGKPILLYFSSAPIPQEILDTEQIESLRRFKERVKNEGLISDYSSVPQFRELLLRHLSAKVRELEIAESPTNNSLDTRYLQRSDQSPQRVVSDYKRFVRSTEGEWKALVRNRPFVHDSARSIMREAKAKLVLLRGEEPTRETELYDERIDAILNLMNRFIDSRNTLGPQEEFWALGNKLVQELRSLVKVVEDAFGRWV